MIVLYRVAYPTPIRAAEFWLEGGRTESRILEISYLTNQIIERGAASLSLNRRVLPQEGDQFLMALKESLRNSGHWYLQEESEN
jgi:hypothetical protein